MANIAVRKDDGNRPANVPAISTLQWEPMRLLRDLMGWDPFGEMSPLVHRSSDTFNPTFEVKETKDSYIFKADVPGVKDSDLEVTVTGNRLSVSGKREIEHKEQTDTYYTYERSYGDFTRSFTLPEGINTDSVAADLKDGVLTVSLKKRPELQPKKVPVQTAAKKS
jgi:HSP20 family protein